MNTDLSKPSRRTYKFSELGANEIRLLRCQFTKHGQLIGKMKTFSLETSTLPPFRTVSYTWNPISYPHRLLIDNQELPVLSSMYSYLHMILHGAGDSDEIWYWIDSLCINQDNIAERNAQIKIMGQIYRRAAQCDVWLGEEAEESWRAFRFLRFLDREFHGRSSWPSVDWIENNAVEKLFARPWWTRVWTVQEFILSKHVVFRCGTLEMSRSLFRNAIHLIWECRNNELKSDGPWNRIRLHEWYAYFGEDEDTKSQSASLTATLAYLGNHQATDPRDRIYSLCSLAKDPDIAGIPDYSQSVEIVYINLVRSFIEVHKSLDIICFSSIFRDRNNTFTSLPSWVPDWRITRNVLVGPLMVSQGTKSAIGNLRPLHSLDCTAIYSASLCVEPKVKFSPDLRKMACRGIFLDRIDGLAGLPMIPWADSPREADELTQSSSSSSVSKDPSRQLEYELAIEILINVMRCLVLNREDHYFNHAISDSDCLKQFASLLSKAANCDPSLHSTFTTWYAANRKLFIRGWKLEDLTKEFLKAVDLKNDVQDLRFDGRVHNTLVKMKRRFIMTNDSHLGMAPSEAMKGDFVCILYGCSVPVVLRWCAEKQAFSLIGECYLNGFMNGKALTRHLDSRKREFGII
ncbi:heterokaryon incompatibility protein-domain-containing protein [Paraphoma chrysanthemicola]|nr:heterokaryon incompatibility protein-domain-containing protein [Paraphoma chrysanthemicola]